MKEDIKTIKISGKTSDMFSMSAHGESGGCLGEYQGYVPDFINDGEDYIWLEIEVKTGKIVGWIPPSQEELRSIIK